MKKKFLLTLLSVSVFSGCCCDKPVPGREASALPPRVVEREAPEVRWEESMQDTIDVPGQLDPSKTYYRAPHRTVVEIRPGKQQNVTYSGDK